MIWIRTFSRIVWVIFSSLTSSLFAGIASRRRDGRSLTSRTRHEVTGAIHVEPPAGQSTSWTVAASQGRQPLRIMGASGLVFVGSALLAVADLVQWSAVAAVDALIFGAALLWWLPRHQVARWAGQLEPKDQLRAETSARTSLAQILAGLVLLVGAVLSWQQIQDTRRDNDRTQQITERGQITDRFTRAVDQLGSDKLQVRLGGIYALERIARDSDGDVGPVMEVLSAFVREQTPWPAPVSQIPDASERPPAPSADVQAVLTVIGRGTWATWWPDQQPGPGGLTCLDLDATDLRRARIEGSQLPPLCLSDTNLYLANLSEADLSEGTLVSANLANAILDGADLSNARLGGADLSRASLGHADLRGAILVGANLNRANLGSANLSGADLRAVDLRSTLNLTQVQLDSAIVDETTQLPLGLDALRRIHDGSRPS